jgi:hypothetical protein
MKHDHFLIDNPFLLSQQSIQMSEVSNMFRGDKALYYHLVIILLISILEVTDKNRAGVESHYVYTKPLLCNTTISSCTKSYYGSVLSVLLLFPLNLEVLHVNLSLRMIRWQCLNINIHCFLSVLDGLRIRG